MAEPPSPEGFPAAETQVAVARLIRVRGNKGELAAIPLSDHPERFSELRRVTLNGQSFEVESVWYHKEQPIFKFRGVDSISGAQSLVGADVLVPMSERLVLPGDEYFFTDLMGFDVVEDASGRRVGEVAGWQELSEKREADRPILMEVDAGQGGEPLLVPFAKSIVRKIDVETREIRVELPPGLLELNR